MIHRILTITLICLTIGLQAQKKTKSDTALAGFKFRSIGPAFMSGRIADIAIHPENDNTWYIAVGSGGVWRTNNSGITWEPVFDDQKVYSIGCVTIDPNQPTTIWVGTGENVGGRHVGFGDGIYKSMDGGSSWKNMGLKNSEHLSKIIVHPNNSDVVYVAAQGPLWSSGGERGFYLTNDGGKTWTKTLGDDKWTGVTDIAIDPTNPQVIYAATWDRHRTVAAYMGGGPGTGLHKSTDGGQTWIKLKSGLPKSRMGKIGLAISPQKANVLYAAIELDRRKGEVYRSEDHGMTWKKMSATVAGGTGPHYYQELYASPHKFDRIYLMDVRAQVSEDGGKTFSRMPDKHKHVDNHALAFRKDDPNYLLIGCDGGVYESFDLGENWRYMSNLPLTQYYKVAVDDAEPFYNVYGGTQDNNTQGGPSRTDNVHGIMNQDWYVVLGGDGHQPATEPGNPDIVYAQWQQGNLCRIDQTTGELVYIKPQPGVNDPVERFNWDAPVLVSPHDPKSLYFGSQRLWKSTNRGDKWTAISSDLTKNLERIEQPIMGKKQSWDNAWDIYAMSDYSTIANISESPQQPGLIYVGTDDGLIQVTENGGVSWLKIPATKLGAPSTSFVNDIKADLHDVNTVYACLDNHKFGDYKPYLFKSTNKGKSWKKITNNLPDTTLVWRIVQDHVNKDLLFLATEFGIYTSLNGGEEWLRLKDGLPTISFRDLAIQKRENDLVAASFGRGFYILDDYSPLREMKKENVTADAHMFPIKDAWWYMPRRVLGYGKKGSQGAGHFVAPNPEFGAVVTYHLAKEFKSLEDQRKESEKKLKDQDIEFPGWDALEKEKLEQKPAVIVVIKDLNGNVVRRINAPGKKGIHRIAWDLRYPFLGAISSAKLPENPDEAPKGYYAPPGEYTATLVSMLNGVSTELSPPQPFKVKRLKEGALEGSPIDATASFWRELEDLGLELGAVNLVIKETKENLSLLGIALSRSQSAPGELDKTLLDLKNRLHNMSKQTSGDPVRAEVGEKFTPGIGSRFWVASMGTASSTYGPTQTHVESLSIAKTELASLQSDLNQMINVEIPALKTAMKRVKSPPVKGSGLR